MDQIGSAAEPFSTTPSPRVPFSAARVQAWADIAARLGAVTAIPTQETAA